MDIANLFPDTATSTYTGSTASLWYLGLMTVMTIVPGCIHFFLRDGGAVSIAKLKLEQHQEMIFRMFAWAGAMQIVWGLLMAVVLWRYNALVPLILGMLVIERSLHLWNMWFSSKSRGHRPPEAYATCVMVPANLLFFILSL